MARSDSFPEQKFLAPERKDRALRKIGLSASPRSLKTPGTSRLRNRCPACKILHNPVAQARPPRSLGSAPGKVPPNQGHTARRDIRRRSSVHGGVRSEASQSLCCILL